MQPYYTLSNVSEYESILSGFLMSCIHTNGILKTFGKRKEKSNARAFTFQDVFTGTGPWSEHAGFGMQIVSFMSVIKFYFASIKYMSRRIFIFIVAS